MFNLASRFASTGLSAGRFYRARVLLATALLAGCPLPARAQALPPLRVAFLGDSLTAGLGLSLEEAYPAILERRLAAEGRPIAVVNAGVSGDTSAGGLRRLAWVMRSRPDVLVVALGANDGLRGLPIAELEKNLRAIVARAKAADVRVLLAGMFMPPNLGPEYTAAFNAVYPRIAQDEGVPLVPFLLAGVAGQPDLNQPDGIHPTAAGQAKVADNVLPHLRALVDRTRAAAR